MRKFTLLFLFVSLLFSLDSFAAKRYWIASSAAYWNNTANWSSSSGGAGGSSVPTSSDTAYFDGNGTGNDTLDANVNVKRIDIGSGYTGTIVQGAHTVAVGTGNFSMAGGTFTGGSSSITITGNFSISGGDFQSTTATLTLYGDYSLTGTGIFRNNSSLVTFNYSGSTGTSSTITISTSSSYKHFHRLTFTGGTNNKTWTITSGDTVVVDSLLYFAGSGINSLNTGTIEANGDITFAGTQTWRGTALLRATGTTNQTLSAGAYSGNSNFLPFEIDKTDTLFVDGYLRTTYDLTLTSGHVNFDSAAVVYVSYGTATISGSFTGSNAFQSLSVLAQNSNYTLTIDDTITVKTVFALTNTTNYVINVNKGSGAGIVNIEGNFSASGPKLGGGGTAKYIFKGTGDQTLSGGASSSTCGLANVIIRKTSGTLTLANHIVASKDWTYQSGTVDPGTSTVYFYTTKTITGSHALNNVTFTGSTTCTFTITSGTSLTINGTFKETGSFGITINTGTIYARGNIDLSGTFWSGVPGSYSLIIDGTGNQTFTGSTNSAAGRVNNVQINKASDTLTLVHKINVYGNWTYTAGFFDPGSSSVAFVVTKTISGSHELNNVTFEDGYTYTIASGTTLTVNGTLATTGTLVITLNTGTINAKGNITVGNTYAGGGGSATINITGDANQTFTGSGTAGQGRLPKITIDKDSGTLTLASVISISGDWIYTKGSVNPGSSTVALYGSNNLDGQESGSANTMSFYNLTIAGNTRTLTGNIDVDNNLTINSSTTLTAGTNKITVGGNWNSQGTWTYSTGSVVFDGNGYNNIDAASGPIIFYDLTLAKATDGSTSLTCSKVVKVYHAMTLTQGHLITTSTNYLGVINDATVTGGSDTAYICGPVRKTGDDAFTFPLGDTTLTDSSAYHPLGMTAPSSTTDQFEARYYAVGQTVGDSLVDSLASVSADEYWTFERKAGTSDVVTTLGWNKNSMSIQDLNVLRMASWNGVKWLDLDIDSISVNTRMGTFIPLLTPVFNSGIATLTFANKRASVPYALLKKKLDGGYYQAKNGRLFFRFDEEYTDTDQKLHFNIYDDQHVLVTSDQLQPASIQPTVHYGDNRYQMNTLFCGFSPGGALDSGFYILEVINEKNEHWYLRFEQFYDINLVTCYDQPSED